MAKITREMAEHLNKILKEMGVGFGYVYEDETTNAPTIRIVVADNMGWVTSSIVNCTDNYYVWLNDWFKDNYDITLCYNNTGNIIWSNDFT